MFVHFYWKLLDYYITNLQALQLLFHLDTCIMLLMFLESNKLLTYLLALFHA